MNEKFTSYTCGVTNVFIDFACHMYETNMGELKLEAKDGNGSWHLLWSKAGNQGKNWRTETVSLNDLAEAKTRI